MNRKGQTFGIAIMTAIFVFIIGMLCINFLFDDITIARDSLSCSDADNISDGTKLLCLGIDIIVPYFIILIISLSIGLIIERMFR